MKVFRPFKSMIQMSFVILLLILLLVYAILTNQDYSLQLWQIIFFAVMFLFLFVELIIASFPKITFSDERVLIKNIIGTKHKEHKPHLFKTLVLDFNEINSVNYTDYPGLRNNTHHYLAIIELKDNNKELKIDISGFFKKQREEIRKYFDDIFISRNGLDN